MGDAAGADAQALVQALNNASVAIQNAIAQAAAGPGAPAAGPFLRTPLRAGIANTLDFSTKEGRKYYEQATRSLFSTDEKFDVEPGRFQLFVNLLHTRARDLGMLENGANCMVTVPAPPGGVAPPAVNMITDYGRLTLEEIKAYETTFIGQNTRNSQNSKMLHDLIMNSLSPTGIQRIQIWTNETKVNGEDAGGCLFKVVIRESYLDSNATVTTLRLNLTNLDRYIETNGSDIVAFNAYVQSQVDGLASRGHTSLDLIVNLFKGYKAVKDDRFQDYIQKIEDGHEDGSNVITSANELMVRAVNFYKKQVTRDEWEQPTQHQKEVLALQAEVLHLKKQSSKNNADKAKGKDGVHKKGTKAKLENTKQKPERPGWLKDHTKPKQESLTKYRTWNGTKWYWCDDATGGKCGGKWRTHKPADCKGYAKPAPKTSKTDAKEEKKKKDALKMAVAHETLVESMEDEQEDSDYES